MILSPNDLQWIQGPGKDDPSDQCAHGRIAFQVNDSLFVKPEDGLWNVTATGLFLLRTLFRSHTRGKPVCEGNFLIPCCGHSPYPHSGEYGLILMGCSIGIDPEVILDGEMVTVRLAEAEEKVRFGEWRAAVLGFADEVRAFYGRWPPKAVPDDELDRQGWEAFWIEWEARRETATRLPNVGMQPPRERDSL